MIAAKILNFRILKLNYCLGLLATAACTNTLIPSWQQRLQNLQLTLKLEMRHIVITADQSTALVQSFLQIKGAELHFYHDIIHAFALTTIFQRKFTKLKMMKIANYWILQFHQTTVCKVHRKNCYSYSCALVLHVASIDNYSLCAFFSVLLLNTSWPTERSEFKQWCGFKKHNLWQTKNNSAQTAATKTLQDKCTRQTNVTAWKPVTGWYLHE